MEGNREKKLQPELRKVLVIGGSHYLCIPKKFVMHYNIRAGDTLAIVAKAEMLTVLPIKGD